jgi:hypothetical protein
MKSTKNEYSACVTDLAPRYQVLVTGKVSFAVKCSDPYEALGIIARAEATGYKAKMKRIPR